MIVLPKIIAMKTILIVDAIPGRAGEMAKGLAPTTGYSYIVLCEEKSVLDWLKNNEPNLIILEPVFPSVNLVKSSIPTDRTMSLDVAGSTGFLLYEHIVDVCTKHHHSKPKFIICSIADKKELMKAGFDANMSYLTQPLTLIEISREIQKVLSTL